MKSFEMLYVQLSVGRSSQRAALRPIFRLPIMLLAVFCLMVANILFAPKAFATEFLVNTTTANGQSTPVIAELVGGGFVITWRDDSQTGGDTSDGAIRAQRYDTNGVVQGAEFLVNTTTGGFQLLPSIAGLTGGGFVIAWQDFSQTGGDTSGSAIRAQRYNATGVAQGVEFLVNTTTANDQGDLSITNLVDGGFVITWRDDSQTGGDTSNGAIRAQRYDANGVAQGGEFLVNTTTVSTQFGPSIAGLVGDGFVIAWVDFSQTGGDTDSAAVRAQRYDANGLAQGAEFLVNTTTANDQGSSSIAGLSDGGFVITWADSSQTGGDVSGDALRAQRYDTNGVAQGVEFLINTTTENNQSAPNITELNNGGFAITWTDFSASGGDTSLAAIRAQRYGANGVAQGAEFLVNTTTAGNQRTSKIAGLGNTGFVIIWTDFSASGGDTSLAAIRADIFEFPPEIDIAGNGNPIADGDTIPTLANNTNFGDVALVGGSNANTFIITNSGTDVLNLTGTPRVGITGANAGDFTLTTDAATSVAMGGGTTMFTITFNPSALGARTASISIANNDADENPYTFAIAGTGITPEIDIAGNGVSIADGDTTPALADDTDFGSVALAGGSNANTFTITNSGTGVLSLTGTPRVAIVGANAGDFTLTTDAATSVALGGGTTIFTITFDPSAAGARTAVIIITNDDTDENPYTFTITGTGIGVSAPEMDVAGNGTSIVDGDITPALVDNTNFGNVALAGGTNANTFTVTNSGTGVLNLTGTPRVTIGGTNAGD
ncbi:MAG: choice-of-anchor D domain-containing protein, partial [Robiginitomaculum sp.]|nr:choice-of-anchor D domain-containing protein [Robiginitomaculum sp.]